MKFYSFYGHMGDVLLKIGDPNEKKTRRGRDTSNLSEDNPRGMMVVTTIKSNKDFFCDYGNTNPYDVFHLGSYKKTLQPDSKKLQGKTPGAKQAPAAIDRYPDETEYGLIDPYTVKSDTTSGIVGNITMLKCYQEHFRFDDD